MLAEGYTVYATMRNVDSEAARELTADGTTILFLDVTDPVSIETDVNSVTAKEQIIDVLINNAGVAAAGMSESFHIDQVQSIFDVNVMGLLRVTQAVLPSMRLQQDGLIINIGSILGRVTFRASNIPIFQFIMV